MLKIENTALLIIDVQGRLAQIMYQKERLFENLKKMIKGALALELPIIWLEQLPDKLGPTTPEIAELLAGIKPIVKSSFSCCDNKEFSDKLVKIDRSQLLITGIETHICIYQTTLDLLSLGYDVNIVVDAVSSRVVENKMIGMEKAKRAGAGMTSVETALFELLKTAEHEKFSSIVKIVK